MKLTGLAAIDIAEANGLPLNKYADPIEDARPGLDIAEARKVALEDPSLIYTVVECVGWKQAGESIETPEGINVADYFRDGEYLGADQDGVEPIFAIAADSGKHGKSHPMKATQSFVFTRLEDVIDANASVGGHWFERGTMKFFKTRIESRLIGGKRFISSECGPDNTRKYTIREAQPDGSIDTVGEFQQFATLAEAKANVLMERKVGAK